MGGTGTVPAAAAVGFGAATTLAVLPLTMVVAGLAALTAGFGVPALTATAPATAPAAAAATTGTAPAAGLAVGMLFPARTAVAGRFGLTVMRAVSLGGALLTMVVPDLGFWAPVGAGTAAAGFIGTPPGGGGVTTAVAAAGAVGAGGTAAIGAAGFEGTTGAGAPGAAGRTGLTGRTAPGAFAPGNTGAGGMTGAGGNGRAGAPGAGGITGGGGPALGVPVGVEGVLSMGCVLLGGGTDAAVGVGAVETAGVEGGVAGRMAVVVGETRGGAVTMVDFFLAASASTATSARPAAAAAVTAAGMTDAGLAGTGAAGAGEDG